MARRLKTVSAAFDWAFTSPILLLCGLSMTATPAHAQQGAEPSGDALRKAPSSEIDPSSSGEAPNADAPKEESQSDSVSDGSPPPDNVDDASEEGPDPNDKSESDGDVPSRANPSPTPPPKVTYPDQNTSAQRVVNGGAVSTDETSEMDLDDVSLVELLQLDLRVATTKTNTTIAASPAAVIVIPREDIERYGYRSVADALRDVVGTFTVDDHITPNLGVRGVPGAAFEGSGAVKVMIDGIPVAFRTTGENWLGPALVPMASVERIEIVKGPTSSLYGADAFLGVINVITKQESLKSWGEVGATGMMTYAGKPGAHIEAAGEVVHRPWRFSLGAQFDQENRSGLDMPSTSPRPSLSDSAGNTSQNQVLRSGVTTFRLSHTPNRKTTYSLSGRYARQLSRAEFAPWLQFTNLPGEDVGTQISLHQGTLTFKASSSFTREFRLEFTGSGFFGATLPGDRIDTGDSLSLAHRDLSYFGGEGTVEGIWQPVDPLRVVLGVEGSADREHLGAPDYRNRETGEPISGTPNTEDFETSLFNVAGRAQVTWEIIEKYLVPTGGIRIDHNTVYGERVSGRLALVSQIVDDLHLKTAYGTAFKAATPLLLYGQPLTVGDVIGSPSLKPQELRSWEFTADYRPAKIADFELTVSNWQLIDRAVFRPEQINLVARNAADANGWTIEAQMKTRFSDHLGFFLGAEWVKVRRESGEGGYRGELFANDSAIYPDFLLRGRVWVQPPRWPLEVWTAGRVVGPRKASDSNTLEAADRYVLPTYFALDAGIRSVDLEWWNGRLTEISVRAENVANSAKPSAGFFGIDYPIAPPKVLLELRQEL